jgi:hypothetical protein
MYELNEDGTEVPKQAGVAKDPYFYVFLYPVHWLHFIRERKTQRIIKKQGGDC